MESHVPFLHLFVTLAPEAPTGCEKICGVGGTRRTTSCQLSPSAHGDTHCAIPASALETLLPFISEASGLEEKERLWEAGTHQPHQHVCLFPLHIGEQHQGRLMLNKVCLDTKLDQVKKTTVFLLSSVYMAHINTVF